MMARLMRRPLPPGLARLLGAGTARSLSACGGASAQERPETPPTPPPTSGSWAAGRRAAALRFPERAARGRREPGPTFPATEELLLLPHRHAVAARGRCLEEATWAQHQAAASRGSRAGGEAADPGTALLGGGHRVPAASALFSGTQGGWLPRLPCPEEDPPAQVFEGLRTPSREPRRMRLWPNPERPGGHRSRRASIPAFAATAVAAAAGVALCHTRSHASKEDSLLEAARINNVVEVDR